MVSKLDRGRARRLLSSGALLWLALSLGCSRRAEVEDTPDAGDVPVTEAPRPDGGVPTLEDAGLGVEPAECGARPSQPACSGTNDFGCDLDAWLEELAELCQQQSDCHTDGWVEVRTDDAGCASELRMEDPDPEYVACITEQLSQFRCPCKNVEASRFLGVSNDGCPGSTCSTGELRCPPGSSCVNGQCVSDDASPGAGGGS